MTDRDRATGFRTLTPSYNLTMAFADAENYRQLQQEYDRALESYQQAEAAYREAAQRDPTDPALAQQYEDLASRRRELEQQYDRLKEIRSGLASERDAPMTIGL